MAGASIVSDPGDRLQDGQDGYGYVWNSAKERGFQGSEVRTLVMVYD